MLFIVGLTKLFCFAFRYNYVQENPAVAREDALQSMHFLLQY